MNGARFFSTALNSAAESEGDSRVVSGIDRSLSKVARQLAHEVALESQHLPHAKQVMSAIQGSTYR
jgi:hypothetical protein